MSIRNRLTALESRQVKSAVSKSGASTRLLEQLHSVADRLRATPLDDVTANASPVEIAALVLDGRVDDEVARQCVELSKQSGTVAKLFQSILHAAGCSDVSTIQEA